MNPICRNQMFFPKKEYYPACDHGHRAHSITKTSLLSKTSVYKQCDEGSWRLIKWAYSPAAKPVSNRVRKLRKKSDDNNQSSNPNFQKLSMLQSCHGWADKMRCFFLSECETLVQTYAKARCFSSASSAALSTAKATPSLQKRHVFFCFCRWKELFEASYWNLFSTTLWYLSCAPGGARSANSSNVSVRPTSWRLLA